MGLKKSVRRFFRDLPDRITKLRHREHAAFYRDRYIRYYYAGRFTQYRSFFQDRVLRQPYLSIDYDGEFGTELKFVIPFAYWHHCNGTLIKTSSSKHTRPFYFFSPEHEEKYESRTWRPYFRNIPNSEDHNIKYNLHRWKRVPFKSVYQNSFIRFNKPMLIVANKYNSEWGGPPVNFLGLNVLRSVFSKLSARYQIIYNRPGADSIANDESKILELGDWELLKNEFPEVLDMASLYEDWRGWPRIENYNEFQLMVYANCERFLSVHGGSSVLASYFGGVNIIYSVKGFEHYFGEFEWFYPQLSGAKVLHARTEAEVVDLVEQEFLTAG